MVKLPINRKENVRRMLKTGKHQTSKNQISEEIWLIYYLQKSGKKKDEIFEIWKNFYFERVQCKDESDAKIIFGYQFKEAPKTRFFKEPEKVSIYLDEIIKINNLCEPLWIKEYILCFISWIRASGEYDIFEELPMQDIYKMTHRVSPNKSEKRIIDALLKNGFIKEVKTHDEYYGSIIFDEFDPILTDFQDESDITVLENKAYSYCFESDKSVKVLETNCCQDVSFILPLISNKCKCKKCGAEFEFSEKTKRDVCENCWKKSRSLKESERYFGRKDKT